MSIDQIVAVAIGVISSLCFFIFIKALRSGRKTTKINVVTWLSVILYVVWIIGIIIIVIIL